MVTKEYEMKEGIEIQNVKTLEIGTAIEYTYSTFFAYRFMKEPDCVRVKLPDNGGEVIWHLRDCVPA